MKQSIGDNMKNFTTIFALFSIAILLASCTAYNPNEPTNPNTPNTPADVQGPTGSQELKTFANREELLAYLKEASGNPGNDYNVYARAGGVMMEAAAMDSVGAPAPNAVKTTSVAMNDGAEDYSATNVQVEGVDEADIVKNDDKYIYVLSGETLAIVNAYPAENAELASETHLKGNPKDLLLNGDTLIIFSEENAQRMIWPEWGYMPQPRYSTETRIQIYDVSDRENPEKTEDYTVTGNYVQSRMTDGYVYAVITDNAYWNNWFVDLPTVRAENKVLIEPRVHYFDNPEDNYRFSTIVSINTADGNIDAESYLMGYANTIYMSLNNLYVAYQKQQPYWYYNDQNKERFFDVVLPNLPSAVRSAVDEDSSWAEISTAIEASMSELDENELNDLFETIADDVADWDAKRAAEQQRTTIQKFSINKGKVTYEGRGEVAGTLLNQFSLDEYEGNLRVATNTNLWTSKENIQHNNVYVLDESLDVIGKLEGIAEDERIYSTRFMGDTLYMVTFRQVDPFFVIDLSNPNKPKILGQLKIPGWSSYLHPYDANHIIGVGKETTTDDYGRVTSEGIKVALFDVSNPEKPIEVDKVTIGDAGSDSEVLNDHKAFLFDKEKELLVIPVREINGDRYNYNRVKQGAVVIHIDENGLRIEKKITHYDGTYQNYWGWYGSPNAVRRALYMDDVLYTISMETIKMHSLDDYDKIGEIQLPYEAPSNNYPIYYGRGIAVDTVEPNTADVAVETPKGPVDDWIA